MLFSSIVFLFWFFPAVLILYYGLSFSRLMQNIVLMLASLFFYAWGEPVYVFLMIGSILFNTMFGYLVEKSQAKLKKFWLFAAVIVNLGSLFIFKYLGFTLEATGLAASGLVPQINLALPIGISFFTFQALSYVVDVYRGDSKAANPFIVGLYVSFFPQLIAGPIVTYNSVEEQIYHRKETFEKFSLGCSRFAVGMIKKILLANIFAILADKVFGWSAIGTDLYAVPMITAWIGAIAYTLQIYYDFSAYSDMAIGLGLCFGFKFQENFNYPYIADSVTEFWKRWHISLTSWFRQYIYFPLGGNRFENQDYMVRNMLIVWLFTGIWHGANWTFIIWGLYYFVFQLFERFTGLDRKFKGKAIGHLYALLIVMVGWIIFRSDNLYQAGRFIMNMLCLNNNGIANDLTWFLIKEYWVFLLLGVLFSMPIARKVNEKLFNQNPEKTSDWTGRTMHYLTAYGYPAVVLVLFMVSVSYLAIGSYNPFIYFNF